MIKRVPKKLLKPLFIHRFNVADILIVFVLGPVLFKHIHVIYAFVTMALLLFLSVVMEDVLK